MATDTAPALQRPDAPPALAAEIRGLVDNATPDRLYGWAWNAAAAAERLTVEARLGGVTVHATVADLARPDLAKAGVGDGCHAFEIPLEAEWIRRRSELAIIARAADSTEAPVPVRLRRAALEGEDMQRTVEALVAGQRRLHEELRVLSARMPDGAGVALQGLAQSHADLQERLEVLAIWLTRVDERLAALPAASEPPPPRGGGWTLVLGGVLGGLAAGALLLALRLGA